MRAGARVVGRLPPFAEQPRRASHAGVGDQSRPRALMSAVLVDFDPGVEQRIGVRDRAVGVEHSVAHAGRQRPRLEPWRSFERCCQVARRCAHYPWPDVSQMPVVDAALPPFSASTQARITGTPTVASCALKRIPIDTATRTSRCFRTRRARAPAACLRRRPRQSRAQNLLQGVDHAACRRGECA